MFWFLYRQTLATADPVSIDKSATGLKNDRVRRISAIVEYVINA